MEEEKIGDMSIIGISELVASLSGVHRVVRVTGPLPEARWSSVVCIGVSGMFIGVVGIAMVGP
jgi:hypothetical protein